MESNIYADKNILMCEDIFMPDLRELFTKGDILRKLRKRKGLTNLQLRAKSGVNKSTLSKIENDKGGFTDETIGKIASGLGMTKAELYAYLEPETAAPVAGSDFCLEHVGLCKQLEYIMHHGTSERRSDMLRNTAEWIQGNVVTFYAALGGPPIQEVNLKQPPHRAAPGHVRVRR